jgi:hypothetical protein
MALTYNEADAVSDRFHFDKVIRQQVYEDSPFYVYLKKKGHVVTGGQKIAWPIRHVKLSKADAVDARQAHEFTSKETRTVAVLDYKEYVSSVTMHWDEELHNQGKEAKIKLVREKSEELVQDMNDRFATDLFTTNPNGKGFSALPVIVDSGGAYAGIAVSDAAAWASIEDESTTKLELYGPAGALANRISDATFGKLSPNFHWTTKALRVTFESLIEPQKRYSNKMMADAGFKNVTFHGDPVFSDPHCPASTWYGLCMDVFWICYAKGYNFKITKWKELFQAGFINAMAKAVSWSGNIKCGVRKCNLKYTALDSTE